MSQPNFGDTGNNNYDFNRQNSSNKNASNFGLGQSVMNESRMDRNYDALRKKNHELTQQNESYARLIKMYEERLLQIAPEHPVPLDEEIMMRPVTDFLDGALMKKSYVEFKQELTAKENVLI